MSDRPIIYSLEQIRTFDQEWGWKDALIGDGYLARLLIGAYTTVISGFAWAQTATPSLIMNFAEGWILEQEPVDTTQWGELAADGKLIMQTGYLQAGQLAFNTGGMSAGQAQWALVQVGYSQADAVRTGDPTNGVLPYVNVDNPSQPFEGPNNTGVTQPTVRKSLATMSIKYGVAAAAGSAVPPAADPGFVPLALCQLTFGQTQVTTTDLVLAGPAAYAGYPNAPYFPGVTGTIPNAPGGSHHGGIAGQAAKIALDREVSGVMGFPNLPVSNSSPPTLGGFITGAGEIPILSLSNVDPSGNIAGNAQDLVYNTVTQQMWICVTSGTAGTAVWDGVGAGGISQYKNANFTITPGNYVYLVDTSGGDITVNLLAASAMGGTGATFKNIGNNKIIIAPFVGEQIEGNGSSVSIRLNAGDASKLSPRSGYGFYIVG